MSWPYRTKKVVLNKSRPKSLKCPACGAMGTIEISISRDVTRQVGWPVPLGASHEEDVAKCHECGHVFRSTEMTHQMKKEADQLSAQTPTPAATYGWIISIIIGVIIGIIIVFLQQNQQ